MSTPSSQRLASISTLWTQLQGVTPEQSGSAVQVRNQLLLRYCGAVHRYLLGSVRDEALAEELFQQFCLKFLRGDFAQASPEKGRFRDYLKGSLARMMTDHFRAEQRGPTSLPEGVAVTDSMPVDSESEFREAWRNELMQRAWSQLESEHPRRFTVLHVHLHQPEASSAEKAKIAAQQLRQQMSAGNFRVTLLRARDQLATLVRDEVAMSIGDASPTAIDAELSALRLQKYCARG